MNLSAAELRVLGCLVEKEATTPDVYPLSTNALQTACNQRSSRDPVVDFDEGTTKATMISLRERGLARTVRGEGSRVYKHAHSLATALQLDRAELAALSVLMLRGPQTVGEVRTRTERQHEFPSLAAVDDVLGRLAAREPALVRQLPRQPGRKEARWEQTLGAAGEAAEAAAPAAPAAPGAPVATAAAPPLASRLEELAAQVAALHEEVSGLRARLDALERP